MQRHRIRRQAIELATGSESEAARLQSELSRFHTDAVLPLIDRCCSEASDPGRLHRIDSLEIDLGRLDPNDFEAGFLARLEATLPAALAEEIQRSTSVGGAGDPDTTSRLELLALYARTGQLPWWTDAGDRRLLDGVVDWLSARAPEPLGRLMVELTREPRTARRLALSLADRSLETLLRVALGSDIPEELHPTRLIAATRRVDPSRDDRRVRTAAWSALLRAAFRTVGRARVSGGRSVDTVRLDLWREVLARLASSIEITYAALATALWETTASVGDRTAVDSIPARLHLELRQAVPDPSRDITSAEATPEQVAGPAPDQADNSREPASEPKIAKGRDDREAELPASEELTPAVDGSGRSTRPGPEPGFEHDDDLATAASDLPAVDAEEGVADPREPVTGVTDKIPDAAEGATDFRERGEGATEELRGAAGVRERGEEATEDLPDAPPPLDLTFSDGDSVYIDNAGLVILWPFLERFFRRLELLTKNRFRDPLAAQRAVGLLEHIATEDPSPPEYRVSLNKILCGVELGEPLDFGPPVTEPEADHCEGLLLAVIAHAPILGEMSIPAFRGNFLHRSGALTMRDGAWLMRVERKTYDLVLERVPWGMEWIKLPWMPLPLRVEW